MRCDAVTKQHTYFELDNIELYVFFRAHYFLFSKKAQQEKRKKHKSRHRGFDSEKHKNTKTQTTQKHKNGGGKPRAQTDVLSSTTTKLLIFFFEQNLVVSEICGELRCRRGFLKSVLSRAQLACAVHLYNYASPCSVAILAQDLPEFNHRT